MEQARHLSSSAEIVVVISNRPGVLGLKRASLAGIQSRVVDHKLKGSWAEFDGTIDRVLDEFGMEVVCLAGFMRILTGTFVRKWNGKLLNIHPSLLSSFKGVNAQKQALQAGSRVTGCTVHFVAVSTDSISNMETSLHTSTAALLIQSVDGQQLVIMVNAGHGAETE